ncbi:TPA: AbrB/MazE/SpoVT family DNA-binding domain-containing protein [Candidatus Woesearchaeota archaeon]|nr:AbrB/MazE/SpoVT family DNA-binding domain-containing protein [Candidatus Woesearchaeota archaeon]
MAIEVKLKKWGNSFGIVLPMEMVNERGLKEDDQIMVEVVKVANLSKIYGMIKERKMTGQEMKDMVRRGWESESDRRRWKK